MHDPETQKQKADAREAERADAIRIVKGAVAVVLTQIKRLDDADLDVLDLVLNEVKQHGDDVRVARRARETESIDAEAAIEDAWARNDADLRDC